MRSSKLLIFLGFSIFIGFAILGFGGMDYLVRATIASSMILRKGTFVWEMWTTMPIDIFMRFYFFNITNPDEVARGAKPILVEMGPYVFVEDWEKVDLSEKEAENTIRFRMMRTYFFQPHLSNGTLNDEVTIMNVILITVAKLAREFLHDQFMTWQLDDLLVDRGERITKKIKVREFLFEGVSIHTYLELFNNPLVKSESSKYGVGIPEELQDGYFAIFKGRNATDDGWFEVKNGAKDPLDTGIVVSYNDEKKLSIWRGDSCNSIKGSDATFFPPFINKETITNLFISVICRSLELRYHSPTVTHGLDTLQFTMALENWMSPASHPPNWCFCPDPEVKPENATCDYDGVFDASPCLFGAPIVVSQPHFYGAEEWIQDAVVGLKPNFEQHMTLIQFHPLTGIPVKGYARIQFNVELVPFEEMPSFAETSHAIIPIGWMDDGAEAQLKDVKLLVYLDYFIHYFSYVSFVFMTMGIFLFGLGVIMLKAEGPKVNLKPKFKPKGTVKIANW